MKKLVKIVLPIMLVGFVGVAVYAETSGTLKKQIKKQKREKENHANTNLFDYAKTGNVEAVQYMIDQQGANVNAVDRDTGKTALMHAAEGGHANVVELLLSSGADQYAKDKSLKRAYDYGKEHPAVKQILLNSYLRDAAYTGNEESMNSLIKFGANINFKDTSGKTALGYAREGERGNDIAFVSRVKAMQDAAIQGGSPAKAERPLFEK